MKPKKILLMLAIALISSVGSQVTHADPGDSCNPNDQPTTCNTCNRESCQANGNIFQCADGDGSFTNPPLSTPYCPNVFLDGTEFPACWGICIPNPQGGDPTCSPDDNYCGANSCGDEICSDDPANFINGGCIPVDPPAMVCDDIPGICGNGVCEPGESGIVEACNNCVDCLVPNAICDDTTGQFCPNGPAECEDGDVCTLNSCVGSAAPICVTTDLGCSGDVSDGCCPSDCNPREGSACANEPNCDVDCIPNPVPSPSPVPPPLRVGCLQGSGKIGSGTGGPGCDKFSCNLNKNATTSGSMEVTALLMMALGLSWSLTRRGNKTNA